MALVSTQRSQICERIAVPPSLFLFPVQDSTFDRWSAFFNAIFELLFRSGLFRECQVGIDYTAKNRNTVKKRYGRSKRLNKGVMRRAGKSLQRACANNSMKPLSDDTLSCPILMHALSKTWKLRITIGAGQIFSRFSLSITP
jgi:hypothetical protein